MNMKKLQGALVAGTVGVVIGASAVFAGGKVEWPGHKKLQRAENTLGQAKTALEEAAHDCGGHRAKALELTNQALAEVREARNWANAHPEAFKK